MSGWVSQWKQAKVLEASQEGALLAHVGTTAYPDRNRLIVLLSFKAGLRAIEIASLRWRMLTAVDGRVDGVIALPDDAVKGRRGRLVPIQADVQSALTILRQTGEPDDFVIRFRRGSRDRATRSHAVQALFRGWYRALGFGGASSHSGRRTFSTRMARHLPSASIRDLQALLGHTQLSSTGRYIDPNPESHRQILALTAIRPKDPRA